MSMGKYNEDLKYDMKWIEEVNEKEWRHAKRQATDVDTDYLNRTALTLKELWKERDPLKAEENPFFYTNCGLWESMCMDVKIPFSYIPSPEKTGLELFKLMDNTHISCPEIGFIPVYWDFNQVEIRWDLSLKCYIFIFRIRFGLKEGSERGDDEDDYES